MWAIRQTGVYHRHVPNGSGNLWILLHPRPDSTIQARLEECAFEWEGRNGSLDEWEMTHILILSSYFDDWRWYLKSLSAEVELLVRISYYTLPKIRISDVDIGCNCYLLRLFDD